VAFTPAQISDLLGSRDQPANERLRQLAVLELELVQPDPRAGAVLGVVGMANVSHDPWRL